MEQVRGAFGAALKSGQLTPVLFGSAVRGIGAAALLELISWAFPSPLERAPLAATRGEDDLVEVELSEDGPFLAQIIRTMNDEQSGKSSMFRIFRGTPPADGQVINTSDVDADERLGSLFTLRGRDRTNLDIVAPGDIVAVSKLRSAKTGDTLAAPGTEARLERVSYPPPMMSYVLQPTSRGGEDKLKVALDRIHEEDPTLTTGFDPISHRIVLHGMGQAHLDMAVARLKRKHRMEVSAELPPVPYRETLQRAVQSVEGKHKKQSGGAGQFGVCYVQRRAQPGVRTRASSFVDAIVGGSIPRTVHPVGREGRPRGAQEGARLLRRLAQVVGLKVDPLRRQVPPGRLQGRRLPDGRLQGPQGRL